MQSYAIDNEGVAVDWVCGDWRGFTCGEGGWGVSAAPPKSSVDWGRRDGAAAVSADLLKRNMFMKLSGDPNFDTKQGRFVQMPMRSLDPSLRRK